MRKRERIPWKAKVRQTTITTFACGGPINMSWVRVLNKRQQWWPSTLLWHKSWLRKDHESYHHHHHHPDVFVRVCPFKSVALEFHFNFILTDTLPFPRTNKITITTTTIIIIWWWLLLLLPLLANDGRAMIIMVEINFSPSSSCSQQSETNKFRFDRKRKILETKLRGLILFLLCRNKPFGGSEKSRPPLLSSAKQTWSLSLPCNFIWFSLL